MLNNKENVRFKYVKLLTDYVTGISYVHFFDDKDCREKDRLLSKGEAAHLAELLDAGASEFVLDWFVSGVGVY